MSETRCRKLSETRESVAVNSNGRASGTDAVSSMREGKATQVSNEVPPVQASTRREGLQ
jgi:hypothetical protein